MPDIIKKGTPIATKQPDGSHVWDKVGSNAMANRLQIGGHGPTLEQLTGGGYLVRKDAPVNTATHKYAEPVSWIDDGVYVSREVVALTDAEIAQNAELTLQRELSTVRMLASATLLELVAPYSLEERGTWPTQQAEAEAWRLDNSAPCRMLRRIAYHRGISMQVMTDKVLENVEVFEYVAGDILGVQQKSIDDIEAG